jgi:hypothetical protein
MTKSANKVDSFSERLFRCNCAVGDDTDFLQDNSPQMPCEPRCYGHRDEDGNMKPCYGEDADDSDVLFDTVSLDDLLGPVGLGPPTGGLSAPASDVTNIELELEELMENSGDLFDRKGLEINHHREDHYSVNGRSVRLLVLSRNVAKLDLDHYPAILGDSSAEMKNLILVHDGPMWQPLVDYLLQTGKNEFYDSCGTHTNEVVGAARNIDFTPLAEIEDRFASMKFATAEANIRINVANNEKAYRLRQTLLNGPSRYRKGVTLASQGGA